MCIPVCSSGRFYCISKKKAALRDFNLFGSRGLLRPLWVYFSKERNKADKISQLQDSECIFFFLSNVAGHITPVIPGLPKICMYVIIKLAMYTT